MSEPRPVAVIVLAAGEGTRMKSRIPKVLHSLCGRSMLGHVLAEARELDPQRLVVVAGHRRDEISAEAARYAPRCRRPSEPTGAPRWARYSGVTSDMNSASGPPTAGRVEWYQGPS